MFQGRRYHRRGGWSSVPDSGRDHHPAGSDPRGSRGVIRSLDDLLSRASSRVPLVQSDGKSGARLERVEIGGESYVLKHLSLDEDWLMQVTKDVACRPILVWESGLLEQLPPSIDHGIVACARGDRPGTGRVLLRDVGPYLVPEGDAQVSLEQHLRFLDHMAEVHAAFWGWQDSVGLLPFDQRYLIFSPPALEAVSRGGSSPIPAFALDGWRRFRDGAPRAAEVVLPLLYDPSPLVAALERTPQTFIHGDWKMGNLGSHPDGRTILLDWAIPSRAPATVDLGWYLAVNRMRLPHSKEEAIEAYRTSLVRHGIDTGDWWERQLGLALLGTLVFIGWQKVLGDADELAWWEARAIEGARWLS